MMMMPLNNTKRKGRMNPNSSKFGRSKFHSEKNMSCDGIYGNSKLMYAAASLVGCVVQIQVQNGTIFEGVLQTFSHQMDIVLETAHRVNSRCLPTKGIGPTVSNLIASYPFDGGIFEKLVFKLSDVILLQACGVDMDYAIKDNFTDTAISKFNGQIKQRELEPWEGGAGSDNESAFNIEEQDGTNGWDANDMFRLNAEKYGVKSSYDNSLQEYTVPLTRKDTEEYKLQEAKAMKIAQEIETNSSYQSRIQLENGDDEDRFSAVVRPDDSIPTKYVLPHRRRNIPGVKRQQHTSSPVHMTTSSSPKSHPSSGNDIPATKQHFPPSSSSPPLLDSSPSPPPPPSPTTTSTTTTTTSVPKNKAAADKTLSGDDTTEVGSEMTKLCSTVDAPLLPGISKIQILCPPQTLPPRIDRWRDSEKKFSKQKGRTDEIEEFKKFSSNFKLTEEKDKTGFEEDYQVFDAESALLAKTMERTKIIDKDLERSADVVKFSTLNPNAKEFVFNPNAKSFTPRSMSGSTQSVHQAAQRVQDEGGPMVVPPSPQQHQHQHQHQQMMLPHHQPLFTAMAAPHYVMQATPVTMAITSAFSQPLTQTPRFRKAASGQPMLAPATLQAPSQLTVQYATPPGVLHHASPSNQTPGATGGYPQMNFVIGPRVVSPQPVGVIPTSHSVSYSCDASHVPTSFIMSTHPGASHSAAPNPLQGGGGQQHSNHHHHHPPPPPPSSQTPIHPSPSPVHHHHPMPLPHHHHGGGGGGHSQPTATLMFPGANNHHPLHQAAGPHHHQGMSHHPMHHHHHHPGFPGPQPIVIMQHQHHQQHHNTTSLHHLQQHTIHHHNPSQNPPGGSSHVGNMLPPMTIVPTSAAITSASTPPFGQHPHH